MKEKVREGKTVKVLNDHNMKQEALPRRDTPSIYLLIVGEIIYYKSPYSPMNIYYNFRPVNTIEYGH